MKLRNAVASALMLTSVTGCDLLVRCRRALNLNQATKESNHE